MSTEKFRMDCQIHLTAGISHAEDYIKLFETSQKVRRNREFFLFLLGLKTYFYVQKRLLGNEENIAQPAPR
jgi:hypothetical protein